MKYVEFRETIRAALRRSASGRTWTELKASQNLPYSRPCPEWIARLEEDIGLVRNEKKGRALVWKLDASPAGNPRRH